MLALLALPKCPDEEVKDFSIMQGYVYIAE